jgi:hypothetical protein
LLHVLSVSTGGSPIVRNIYVSLTSQQCYEMTGSLYSVSLKSFEQLHILGGASYWM